MIKVSIIIPVYNTAPYLSKCLDSVVGQALKEIEIIIINDASTDNSQRIIEAYAAHDSRIQTVVKKQNEGQGAARNVGIKMAKGEYIGFVDSDDWIGKEMFLSLYNKGVESNSDLVVYGMKYIKNDAVKLIKSDKEQIIDGEMALRLFFKFEQLPAAAACQKMQKREIIIKNKIYFPENVFLEDLLHSFYVFYYATRVHITTDVTYNYIWRKDSTMSKSTRNHIEGIKKAIEEAKKLLLQKGIFSSVENDFYRNFWLMRYHYQIKSLFCDTRYRDICMNSPSIKYAYDTMKSSRPKKKPQHLSMIEKATCSVFFSNKIIFMLYYTMLKLARSLKNRLVHK